MNTSQFQCQWVHENRILYAQINGTLTVADVQEYNDIILAHLVMGQGPIHVIFDLRFANLDRVNLIDFRRNFTALNDEELGMITHVSSNAMVRFLVSTAFQILRKSITFHDSTHDALKYIVRSDDSLPKNISIPKDLDKGAYA